MRTRAAAQAVLAVFLAALLPASAFCADVARAVPAIIASPAAAPRAAPRLFLPAGSLALPALPAAELAAPSVALPGAAFVAQPGRAETYQHAPEHADSLAAAPGARPPEAAGGPAAARPGVAGRSSAAPVPRAAGVDPRGESFAPRVWADAEAHGFARDASLAAAPAGAPSSRQPSLSAANEPGSAAASGAGQAPPPAPPSKPGALSVLSGKVLGFLGTFLLIQLAVESLALTVPQMTDPLQNGFAALAALSATSYLAYSIGSFFGGRLVQRLGLARVYRLTLGLRTALWAGVAAVFHAHHGAVPIAPLVGFFSLDYFVHSMGRVAERTLQGEWFKDAPAASNRFGTLRDFVEYGTVFTTMATGLIIATLGFGAIIYTAPFLFGGAALLALSLRSLPQALSGPQRRMPALAGFRRLFRPDMRAIFLSRLLINNFVYLLYYITATAFGVFYAHGDAGLAAAAASALIGLLGMGANGAALGNAILSRNVEKRTAALPESERAAAQHRLMSASAARALRWASLAILGGWAFVSHAAIGTVAGAAIAAAPFVAVAGALGALFVAARGLRAGKLLTRKTALNAAKFAALTVLAAGVMLAKTHASALMVWPLFAVSPALILIGFTGQTALTQLDTLLLDRMPKRTKAYVVGADRTLTYFSFVLNFLVWGALFQLFGAAAFAGMGVYCTLTAAAYLYLSRRIAKEK